MKGILGDHNIRRHTDLLIALLEAETRREIWEFLELDHYGFDDLGLATSESDKTLWLTCQERELVLLTANRNQEDEDSLEATIRTLSTSGCLPVLTLSDADRFLRDKRYAALTADKMLEILFDIENFLGTGRLYVP